MESAGREARARGIALGEAGPDDGARRGGRKTEAKKRAAVARMQGAMRDRGVVVRRAPDGMSRRRWNATRWDGEKAALEWTVEWVVVVAGGLGADGAQLRRSRAQVPEGMEIGTAYARQVRAECGSGLRKRKGQLGDGDGAEGRGAAAAGGRWKKRRGKKGRGKGGAEGKHEDEDEHENDGKEMLESAITGESTATTSNAHAPVESDAPLPDAQPDHLPHASQPPPQLPCSTSMEGANASANTITTTPTDADEAPTAPTSTPAFHLHMPHIPSNDLPPMQPTKPPAVQPPAVQLATTQATLLPIAATATLAAVLRGRTVLEFPTIYVVLGEAVGG
jgi:hypothetical protein